MAKTRYPILESEIAKNGIKKKDIAAALGITPSALSRKLAGEQDFWLHEAQEIKDFFPGVTLHRLFIRYEPEQEESP